MNSLEIPVGASPAPVSPEKFPFTPLDRRRHRLGGRVLVALGRVIAVAGPVGGLLLLNAGLAVVATIGLWLAILFASLILGGRLVALGQGMSAVDAPMLLRQDQRPPVLYLRRFSEDEFLDPAWSSHQGGPGGAPLRYENSLAHALQSIGPFVALGRPEEDWPPTGAARLYVNDRDWQAAVRFFLAHAAAVVMAVGRSGALDWELGELVRTVDRRRVLFFFPLLVEQRRKHILAQTWHMYRSGGTPQERANAEREQRYQDLRRLLKESGIELPASLGDAAFVDFDVGSQPRLLESKPPGALASVLRLRGSGPRGEIDVVKTLTPFLRKLTQMNGAAEGKE
jgi:hypothetical protein